MKWTEKMQNRRVALSIKDSYMHEPMSKAEAAEYKTLQRMEASCSKNKKSKNWSRNFAGLPKMKTMTTQELETMEAQIVADLRRRHHGGDNEAARILLEHVRAKLVPPPKPKRKCTSAMYCSHANESPAQCPCDADCYCRVEGNCR